MYLHKLWFAATAIIVTTSIGLAHSPTPQEVTINGSENPELIPDSVAFRMVMLSLKVPTTPNTRDLLKQELRLKRLNLTDSDKSAFKALLAEFGQEYERWHGSLAVRSNVVSPQTLLIERDTMFQRYQSLVLQKMSTDGQLKFQQYVAHQKLHMTIP